MRQYKNTGKMHPAMMHLLHEADKAYTGSVQELGSSKFRVSTSTLQTPLWLLDLTMKHESLIAPDAMQALKAAIGTTCHNVLQAWDGNVMPKINSGDWRFTVQISPEIEISFEPDCCEVLAFDDMTASELEYLDGWKDSANRFTDGIVPIPLVMSDFKFSTVYAWPDGKDDWRQKLRWYAALMNEWFEINSSPYVVVRLQNVLVPMDWSASAKRQKNQAGFEYPDQQEIISIHWNEGWESDAQYELSQRAAQWLAWKRGTLKPEPCSDEDVWAKPTKYAVMKVGAKRAVKLHDTRESAEAHAVEDPKLYVEVRPGERPRCAGYCEVADWCIAWAEWQRTNR